MHTPDSSPTARPYPQPAADEIISVADAVALAQSGADNQAELTIEEEAALAVHHRHISETSYLPAQADYLHVR